ncbi:MAG: thiamine-phosphate kinase [Candidatus Altiarchaeales archaeon]|nr:MAG: thiamine-phosphate kinase [Candidatus Altiarchaeales archaeon]
MKFSDLGEKEIVRRIDGILNAMDLNVGDDAAVLEIDDEFLVASTDIFYEETHKLPGMTYEQIAKYVVASNFSDIAAMGAKPVALLVAFGCKDMEISDFENLITSIAIECKRYDAKFIGGDTKYSGNLVIVGTAIGKTKKPVFRSGANVNDIVAVTGTLGDAGLGVRLLMENLIDSDSCKESEVIRKALEPLARVNEAQIIGRFATSMTDISDSLAFSLYDIAEKSGVGFEIYPERFPISKNAIELAREFKFNISEFALYTGGDYELLFTIQEDNFNEVKDEINATEIGRVIKKGIFSVKNGKREIIEKRGYEHFKTKNKKGFIFI